MRIAFLSRYGDGADVGLRLAADGHQVTLYVDHPDYRENFDGLLPKADTWQVAVRRADLVIFDENRLTHVWKAIHRSVPCFGGSEVGARLENDRKFAQQIMERAGLPGKECLTFRTLQQARAHLLADPKPHVVKPQGPKVESHHVVLAEEPDGRDAVDQVERLIDQGLACDSVEVEEKVTGIEVGLGVLCNGRGTVGPVEVNFEHKHSHDGERGFLTGEMGTLMRYAEDPELPLYQETLAKLLPQLWALDYRGEMDLNLIVGEDAHGERRVTPLELTPRLGKPACFLQDELRVTPWAEYLRACAEGRDGAMQVRYDWAVGVVLVGFGFPHERVHVEASKGLVVRGLDAKSLTHVHPMQLRLDKKGRFVTGHGEGYLAVATGRGATVEQAKGSAYGRLDQLRVPRSWSRRDIGDKIDYRLGVLDRLGVLPREEHQPA